MCYIVDLRYICMLDGIVDNRVSGRGQLYCLQNADTGQVDMCHKHTQTQVCDDGNIKISGSTQNGLHTVVIIIAICI